MKLKLIMTITVAACIVASLHPVAMILSAVNQIFGYIFWGPR